MAMWHFSFIQGRKWQPTRRCCYLSPVTGEVKPPGISSKFVETA